MEIVIVAAILVDRGILTSPQGWWIAASTLLVQVGLGYLLFKKMGNIQYPKLANGKKSL